MFLRLMQYLYLVDDLGAMLLIFTRMAWDVLTFICLFMMVVSSTAMALYVNYHSTLATNGTPNKFSDLGSGIMMLIWAIFGKDHTSDLSIMKQADSITGIGNITNVTLNHTANQISGGKYTIGNVLYGMFCLLILLVLLNLCIAMMSDTYTKLKENIDVELSFVRTKLWMDFIRGPTLAPPWNILPTFVCLRKLVGRLPRLNAGNHVNQQSNVASISHVVNIEETITYTKLIQTLKMEYISKHVNDK
ncbi:short transient receptor potential channel 3-like isoform X1 [Ptychodera flava]